MTNIFHYHDYVLFLKDLYLERSQQKKNYTLTLFSSELGIDQSILTRALNGKAGIGNKNALRMANSLFQNEEERIHLLNLIDAKHARSKIKRDQAYLGVVKSIRQKKNRLGKVELEYLSSWLDHAVRQAAFFIKIPRFKPPQKLAEHFLLPIETVQASVSKLQNLGLLEDKGGYLYPSDSYIASNGGKEDEACKSLLKQFSMLAMENLDKTPLKNRFNNAFLMNIKKENLKELRKELERICDHFYEKTRTEGKDDSTFCLAVNFFEIGNSIQKNKEIS